MCPFVCPPGGGKEGGREGAPPVIPWSPEVPLHWINDGAALLNLPTAPQQVAGEMRHQIRDDDAAENERGQKKAPILQ